MEATRSRAWLALGAVLAASCLSLVALPRAAGATGRPPVPPSLTAVESSAEDLVDVALGHDRAGVVAGARELRTRGGEARRTLAGVPAATLAELERRATRVDALARTGGFAQVALAANAVSGLIPQLYARYADPVPPAVRTLDYLEREAQLRSLAGQRSAVPPLVARIARTWSGLRSAVAAHGGQTVAASYGRHVAALTRLAPAGGPALRGEAVAGLELVDALERVFG